jgi:hypothetical protein
MGLFSTTTLRLLAVIPVAIFAWWLAQFVFRAISAITAQLLTAAAMVYVRLVLVYVPKSAAFVWAGATVSPRPLPTAIALAAIAMALSLLVHILSQRAVGMTNWLHFAAESAGALLGLVLSCVGPRVLRSSQPEQ